MSESALQRAHSIALELDSTGINSKEDTAQIIWSACVSEAHPQERTLAFHQFYGAPIHYGKPTMRFEHMTDERVYARVEFILSELKELLRDGLGIEMHTRFSIPNEKHHKNAGWNLEASTVSLRNAIVDGSSYRNLIGIVDALGDLNVVTNGFAIELGVNMQDVDREIAASNFTKADAEGNPIINGYVETQEEGTLIDPNQPVGKVLKGPNFMEPQLEQLLFGKGR